MHLRTRDFRLFFAVLVCLSGAFTVAYSSQINWRSQIAATNLTSDGTTAMGASFVFELGSFANGFLPTGDNVSEWQSRWQALDTTQYNPATRFFSSSILLTTNASPFALGTSGYIWGRNKNQGPDNEWILMRSVRWRWPVANNGVAFPVEWYVDEATVGILGEVNGTNFQMKSARVETGAANAADAWLAAHFTPAQLADSAISGWNADPDKDGCHNLLEFTTGGNPLQVDSEVSSVRWKQTTPGVSGFTLELPVTPAARDLVVVKIQFAKALSVWLTLPAQETPGENSVSFSVTTGIAAHYRLAVAFK